MGSWGSDFVAGEDGFLGAGGFLVVDGRTGFGFGLRWPQTSVIRRRTRREQYASPAFMVLNRCTGRKQCHFALSIADFLDDRFNSLYNDKNVIFLNAFPHII